MDNIRLNGRFTVKEGAEGQLSLLYEAGPGPMVIIDLASGTSMSEAHEVANVINRASSEVVLDFSYSPVTSLGFGPASRLDRLREVHQQLQDAMTALITNNDRPEAERALYALDKSMLKLIEDEGGLITRKP
jgi:hypothetical protein